MSIPFDLIFRVAKTVLMDAKAQGTGNPVTDQALDIAEDFLVGVFPAAERVIKIARRLSPLALERLGLSPAEKKELGAAIEHWDAAIAELAGEIDRAREVVELQSDEEVADYAKKMGWMKP